MSRITNSWMEQIIVFHNTNLYVPTRTIYFGGDDPDLEESESVNCNTAAELIKNLHILDTKESAPITILLNTPGGYWEDGFAIYDSIKRIKSKVEIIGIGKLYSMGSVIFQAGDRRLMLSNSTMMIHDGQDGYIGDPKSFKSWADWSVKCRKNLYQVYYEKMKEKNPKITLEEIESMCSHDTIFNAKECIKVGLADKVLT